MSDLDRRLTAIEIALSHQEAAQDDLSAVVRAQAAQIDRLEARVAALARRLAAALAQAPEDGSDADA